MRSLPGLELFEAVPSAGTKPGPSRKLRFHPGVPATCEKVCKEIGNRWYLLTCWLVLLLQGESPCREDGAVSALDVLGVMGSDPTA